MSNALIFGLVSFWCAVCLRAADHRCPEGFLIQQCASVITLTSRDCCMVLQGQDSSFNLTSDIGTRDLAHLICESRLHYDVSQRTGDSPSTGVCLPSWRSIGGDARDSLASQQDREDRQVRCLQHHASQLSCSTAEEGQCGALDLRAPKLCLEGVAELLRDTADADAMSSYPPGHEGDDPATPGSIRLLDSLKQRLCRNVLLVDCSACAASGGGAGSSIPPNSISGGCRRCAECGRWLAGGNASAMESSPTSSSLGHGENETAMHVAPDLIAPVNEPPW